MTEVSVHKGLNHPHVVRFEEFFEDYYHFYIVLELCLGEVDRCSELEPGDSAQERKAVR